MVDASVDLFHLSFSTFVEAEIPVLRGYDSDSLKSNSQLCSWHICPARVSGISANRYFSKEQHPHGSLEFLPCFSPGESRVWALHNAVFQAITSTRISPPFFMGESITILT
jgi:hypothetical protein